MQINGPQTLALVRLGSVTKWVGLVGLLLAAVLSPAQTLTTLIKFDGAHGGTPTASLVQGTDGNLYGTSEFAGSHGGTNFGGTAFKITPGGTLTTLYDFCSGGSGNCPDGYNPVAVLARDPSGVFYGTTTSGGANGPFKAYGTVFQHLDERSAVIGRQIGGIGGFAGKDYCGRWRVYHRRRHRG